MGKVNGLVHIDIAVVQMDLPDMSTIFGCKISSQNLFLNGRRALITSEAPFYGHAKIRKDFFNGKEKIWIDEAPVSQYAGVIEYISISNVGAHGKDWYRYRKYGDNWMVRQVKSVY